MGFIENLVESIERTIFGWIRKVPGIHIQNVLFGAWLSMICESSKQTKHAAISYRMLLMVQKSCTT